MGVAYTTIVPGGFPTTWCPRVLEGIKAAVPFLNVGQTVNLALLVSAILARRTLNLSALARTYPIPDERRVESPKHGLLHRLKRLSRLLVALTIALSWLTLAALPEIGALPKGWHKNAAQWGRVSVISLALEFLHHLGNLPLSCLPSATLLRGGHA